MVCANCQTELKPWERPNPITVKDGKGTVRLTVAALCDACARANTTGRKV
jgi:hypothetical protein